MSTQPIPRLTPAQYLALERSAEIKGEHFDGQVFAMVEASREHNLIVGNLVGELREKLRGGPCEVYPSDMRVKVDATGLYTYPDVVVVCDQPRFEDEHRDTLLNPTLLIEVLSESTEKYDRGKKSGHYRQLAWLQEYVLVSQYEPHIEHYARQDEGHWLLSEALGQEASIALPAVGARLLLSEIYARVALSG
ncbi:MAG: Uma2 family endonuclease [Pirellulales bacterium]